MLRKMVYVRWLYIVQLTNAPWIGYQEAMDLKPLECHTVGILLSEDEDQVNICLTIGNDVENEDVMAPVSIPKSVVLELSELTHGTGSGSRGHALPGDAS